MSSQYDEFVRLYEKYRVGDQVAFYEARQRDFDKAQGQVTKLSGTILVLAAGVAFLAGAGAANKVIWTTLAAVLPALSTVVAAYGDLYSFERIAKLYRDAARALRLVSAEAPEIGSQPASQAMADGIRSYVTAVESIFQREQGQWGQLSRETTRHNATPPKSRSFPGEASGERGQPQDDFLGGAGGAGQAHGRDGEAETASG